MFFFRHRQKMSHASGCDDFQAIMAFSLLYQRKSHLKDYGKHYAIEIQSKHVFFCISSAAHEERQAYTK